MDVLSKISLTLVKSLQLHSHRLPWCSVLSGNGPTLTYMCKRAIGKISQSACCCIQAKKTPSHEQMATRTRMRRKTGNVLLTVWLFCRAMAAAVQKCPQIKLAYHSLLLLLYVIYSGRLELKMCE